MKQVCPQCSKVYTSAQRYCTECGTELPPPEYEDNDVIPGNPSASRIRRLLPHQYIDRLTTSDGRMRSERRTVTTLFADIVGSTALAEALDPEDVTDIVNGAFRVLTEPIKRYDGTLARLMGDAILALFGAPIAHDNDPVRACRAALDILHDTEEYAEELKSRFGIPFQIRVGISTGLAVVGEVGTDERSEYTAIGDAVNLAARLQSFATPGTAAIDGRTHSAICQTFATVERGPTLFKGKSEPVNVYELRGEPPAVSVTGSIAADTPFVNRRTELFSLKEWISAVSTGTGTSIRIGGDAGSGKSRLLAEVQGQLDSSVRWIVGHGQQMSQEGQYGIVRDIVLGLLDREDSDPDGLTPELIRDRLGVAALMDLSGISGAASAIHDTRQTKAPLLQLINADLSTDEREYLEQLPAEDRRLRLRQAVVALSAAEAKRRPTVLQWDDAQWIDPESQDVLDALIALTGSVPLVVIVSSRHAAPADPDTVHTLHLDPLSSADSRTLLDEMVSSANVPAPVRDRILAVAEGNPLCLEEMARTIGEGGPIVSNRDLGGGGAVDIPISVQGAILARVDRLAERERNVLQTASVIGRAIQPDVLHLALHPHISLEDFTAALERLERESFFIGATDLRNRPAAQSRLGFSSAVRLAMPSMLKPGPAGGHGPDQQSPLLVFKHATAAEVIYQSLLRSERRDIHRRVGAIMESLYPDQRGRLATSLAYHFGKAGAVEKELDYLILSADRAFELNSLVQAIEQYERALTITSTPGFHTDSSRHVHVLSRLGDCHRLRGEYHEALDRYRQALGVAAGPAETASLHDRIGRIHGRLGHLDDAQSSFETGIDQLRQEMDERTLAKLYLGLSGVHNRMGREKEAREIGDLALAVARQGGDQRDEALANCNLGMCQAQSGDREGARRSYSDARVVLEAISDRYSLAVLLNNMGCLSRDDGDLNDAIESFTRSLELFIELDNHHAQAHIHNNLSDTYYLAGFEDRAHHHLEQAAEILANIGLDKSGPIEEMWQSGIW